MTSTLCPHRQKNVLVPHLQRLERAVLVGVAAHSMLAASAYNEQNSQYLVNGFREVFHLRLDRPIRQLVEDRTSNVRLIKGNNKTALANPRAV